MLKKLFKSVEPNLNRSVFPIQPAKYEAHFKSDDDASESSTSLIDDIDTQVHDVVNGLVNHEPFIQKLEELLTQKILNILLNKYGFEPTNKYLQEIEDKKKYINQLDVYLDERKQINSNIEQELQQFLQNTTDNIRNALNEFSHGIHMRIVEAESRYGIDKIKHIVLNDSSHEI